MSDEAKPSVSSAIHEALVILDSLESNNHAQGRTVFKSAIGVLQSDATGESELKALYINFCGYLAHGEYTTTEHQAILKLLDLLAILAND